MGSGSAVSARQPARAARREEQKRRQHQNRKADMHGVEYRFRALEENQPVKQSAYERAGFDLLTGERSELIFPMRERTLPTHHGLERDDDDGNDVRGAEPEVSRPLPAKNPTEHDR